MLIKKGTVLKIKNREQLKKDHKIIEIFDGFVSKGYPTILRCEMIDMQTIIVQENIVLSNYKPIFCCGWFWLLWMFDVCYNNSCCLELE